MMNLSTGCIVEYSAKGTQPETGVVLSAASGSVRLYLLNGKETTVPEKRILHSTSRAVTSVSDRETCRQNLIKTNSRRSEIAQSIDLAELHSLLVEEQRPYSFFELSGFLFSPDDEDSAAALLRCLSEDRLYFKNRNETWQPATADELKQALELHAKKELAEREEAHLIEALKQLGGFKGLPDVLKDHISDLKNLVACGEEAKIPRRLASALDKAGLSNPRKLFQALVASDILSPDENLAIIRFRLPVEFAPELLAEAETLRKTEIRALPRVDLCGLRTWAIDTPGSQDRDDAFSFAQHSDGSSTLWVHIADPAELILPGSPLDREASSRASSVYMPDQRIHMLPPEISENFLSLSEGSERLALTFMLEFSP
ncbi:MAG: RNB domain-containing ribonuclease, partial [Candidatus Riflebacteria bacterium]|nr:RNB domain-containing ribonuclease [Candidatus Riflebacteria bacterium]